MTFDETTQPLLLDHARHLVDCAVRGVPVGEALPDPVAAIPCHGLFITLKRGHLLRGCIGNYRIDEASPVAQLLAQAAPAVAARDHRFPPIVPEELPFLTIEITPMHSFREVEAQGEARVGEIEIGRHGVILSLGNQRGLLLPQVAVENDWDAPTFLRHVSLKAGLPENAWLARESRLTIFEGDPFTGGAPKPDVKQSAIRNAFTLLTVVPYLGGLLAVVAYIVIAVTINNSPTKQGKHDELAGGTQVVKKK